MVGTALSSRGLGHGPLKAGTRVRIPLALLQVCRACSWCVRQYDGCSVESDVSALRRVRLSVRTGPFQGLETGSTPVRATSVSLVSVFMLVLVAMVVLSLARHGSRRMGP